MLKLKNDSLVSLQRVNDPEFCRGLTMQKCMGSAIANITDQSLRKSIYVHVLKQVLSIAKFYNTARNITDSQAGEVAEILMEKFKDWSIEDFTFWAKTVKMKQVGSLVYPQNYQTIDPATIVGFADTYADAKAAEREEMWRKEKGEYLKRPEQVPSSFPSLQPIIDELAENIKASKTEYSGSGNPEKLREQLSVETDKDNSIDSRDPHKAMKEMFERVIGQFGQDSAAVELEMYKVKNGENDFTRWADNKLK